ncbi:hypothetical protein ILYODFUR_030010, partial [Ilyodon furcidens]
MFRCWNQSLKPADPFRTNWTDPVVSGLEKSHVRNYISENVQAVTRAGGPAG